jgi:3-methyladenine DNA glycosylase AlkD
MADPSVAEGVARYGIPTGNVLGITAPQIRSLAKNIGVDQPVSLQLWKSGIHEARILAALVGDPDAVTKRQMEVWAREFDSWSVCDACCCVLFDRTAYAMEMAFKWSRDRREFVKRAGFVLMAAMAVHHKTLDDAAFIPMLAAIKERCNDDRGFAKKGVNWALRQIGKRNLALNGLAIKTGLAIRIVDSPSARWIASDALRELRSDTVQRRLLTKARSKSRR